MAQLLNRAELLELVAKLLNAEGSPKEINAWIALLEASVPDPNVLDLIYWPDRCGLGANPDAEAIVNRAMG
jgi:hypothetical protein